jgi:hypothetical protein
MGALTSDPAGTGPPHPAVPQRWLLQLDTAVTVLFTVLAIAAVAVGGAWVGMLVALSAVLFIVGSLACLWAFAVAVQRSRSVEIAPTQLYFLTGGCAPVAVRNRFMILLAAQVVVGLIAASVRPFTGVAFGILVPMFGLGVSGLWAARNGVFPDRVPAGGSDRSPGRADRQE